MARLSLCLAAVALACLSSGVLGVITLPGQSILNTLTVQQQIVADADVGNQEQNPYALVPITINGGKLKAGCFLATNWNDKDGNFGQGRTILRICPNNGNQVIEFATISATNPLIAAKCNGNIGVGLTMAMVILSKGYVIVGSTPVNNNPDGNGNKIASPGCLIALNNLGQVLDVHSANEMTTSNTMTGGGPWGMAVQEFNNGANANLFVSYVLGTNPASATVLTGADGGMVVRYGLQLIGGKFNAPTFWGKSPDVIASGFPTTPGGIMGGTVGPAGLAIGQKQSSPTPYDSLLSKNSLYISNCQNGTIDVVQNPNSCFTRSGASPQCTTQVLAYGGLLAAPIGIAISPVGTIVAANGAVGTLVEIAPTLNANLQLAVQLVDNVNDAGAPPAGAGNLFNILFHPLIKGKMFFNDDNFNAFYSLSATGLSSGRKLLQGYVE